MASSSQTNSRPVRTEYLLALFALLLVMLVAGYFRLTGLMWGQYEYEHPDERFLVWVVADIAPVDTLGDYFNTATSTLNPTNRGHAFYVYGDFPVIITRYATGWFFDQVGWMEILQTGRALSAFCDLLTVLLVFLIAEKLFRWRVALVAGLFSAAAVLQIQQAHFFTSDSFSTLFTTLAVYLAVCITRAKSPLASTLGFGAAVGMAMACKINTFVIAGLLPIALFFNWYAHTPAERRAQLLKFAGLAILSGIVAFAVFRLAQPYAFSGPSILHVIPDPAWVKTMQEQRAQASGDVDFPPALQWARRSKLFSLVNLVTWGLGLPLGLLAWAGVAWLSIRALDLVLRGGAARRMQAVRREQAAQQALLQRGQPIRPRFDSDSSASGPLSWLDTISLAPMLKDGWPGLIILLGWTVAYFAWQSMAWNPTMRYQLPIYPTLAILAAAALADALAHPPFHLWGKHRASAALDETDITAGLVDGTLLDEAPQAMLLDPDDPSYTINTAYTAPPTLGEAPHAAPRRAVPGWWKTAISLLGALVLVLTLAWAFAFTRNYNRTETRVEASLWLLNNAEAPFNLVGTANGEPWQQLLSHNNQAIIRQDVPYWITVDNPQPAALSALRLTQVNIATAQGLVNRTALRARLIDPAQPDVQLGEARVDLPNEGNIETLDLNFADMPRLEAGHRYTLALDLISAQNGNLEVYGTVISLGGPAELRLFSQAQTIQYNAGMGLANLMLPNGGSLTQMRMPAGSQVQFVTVMLQNPLTNEQFNSMAVPASADPAAGGGLASEATNADGSSAQAGGSLSPDNAGQLLIVNPPISIRPGVSYLVTLIPAGGVLDPSQTIQLDFMDNPVSLAAPESTILGRVTDPLWVSFTTRGNATLEPDKPDGKPFTLQQVTLAHVAQVDPAVSGSTDMTLNIYAGGDTERSIAQAHLSADLSLPGDARGGPQTFSFDPPVTLIGGQFYSLRLTPETGALAVRGSAIANETDWDMGLPFRMGNYDPFGGIYRGDLNFQMYWDDNPEKYVRFVNNLDQADYIAMSSNRQWGTTTRIPERYPLTTALYRELLGCPPDRDVIWCYNVAETDPALGPVFQGRLGYDLAGVFTSYPNIGPLRINDQWAEEAFTVYDHPKVMIFKKRADYNPSNVRAILGAVDLTKVIHLTPRKANDYKQGILPVSLWSIQQAGGTWAKLFPPEGLQNQQPWLGALLWYLTIFVLGLFVYPLVRLALPGLPDKGYPLARVAGLVLLGYGSWLAGSLGLPVTRPLVGLVFAGLGLLGLGLGWLQRGGLVRELRERRGYFLSVEAVALALFAIQLAIRIANPDLWHPVYGGEKPMDFSYFNAVLKSTIFPPYDPWFAGGSMNYYYYGYVLVGMPLKLVGITPSVGYNLILPMLFSAIGLSAFSIGWNLYAAGTASGSTGSDVDAALTRFGNVMVYPSPAVPSNAADGVIAEGIQPKEQLISTGESSVDYPHDLQYNTRVGVPNPAPVDPALSRRVTNPQTGGSSAQTNAAGRAEVSAIEKSQVLSSGNGYTQSAVISTPRAFAGRKPSPFWFALAAAVALLILGNLGTVRMFWLGWQKIIVPEEQINNASLAEHVNWAARGFSKWVSGEVKELPFYPGDWYWKPSRAIQPESGNEITEFPFFTFTYADLHAHLIALPVTLLVIGWGLGMLLGRRRRTLYGELADDPPAAGEQSDSTGKQYAAASEQSAASSRVDSDDLAPRGLSWLHAGAAILLGALATGALRPANTWDQYTYLTFAALTLFYGTYRQGKSGAFLRAAGQTILLVGLALLLYRPFDQWFGQGYNSIELWMHAKTGLSSYLVHWGLFLFVIAAWLFDETVDWLAHTPLSALNHLRPYRGAIIIAIAALFFALLALLMRGVVIALIVVPLGVWAALLLSRPNLPEAKRFTLLMLGTGLLLTLAVELVAVKGDIGRMNTVFKFYYQAWSLISLSAAAGLGFLWSKFKGWNTAALSIWATLLVLLVGGAALFPWFATQAKVTDRMEKSAPVGLDGMTYMNYATYTDGVPYGPSYEMDLSEDYRAIQWAQRNIPGSPVIVEANTPEYRHWGTRFTIYTGLPGVIGWNWHERQQRALTPDTWIFERITAVQDFYSTTDPAQAEQFLKRYNVQYIILGQIERIWYDGPGLAKFTDQDGTLWEKVYDEGQTEIYRVK